MLKPVQHDVGYSRFLNRRFIPHIEMTMKPDCHSEQSEESHIPKRNAETNGAGLNGSS
ncbi:hypothetical protein [Allomuricauda sp. M10]|uniref:hypothetical protein n=1 Tax=Allomuricauda sp. M10 TaxID=2683292 RepID=UPI001D188194|nr:hypothetical protein [Muricauda sp. M10]